MCTMAAGAITTITSTILMAITLTTQIRSTINMNKMMYMEVTDGTIRISVPIRMQMALIFGITSRLTTHTGATIMEQTGTNTAVHSIKTSTGTTHTTMITSTATNETTTTSITTRTTTIRPAASTTMTTIQCMTLLTQAKHTTASIGM